MVDAVGGLLGVDDLHVKDAVDLDGDVVPGDALLGRDVDRLLFQRVLVGDPVEEGDEDVEPASRVSAYLPSRSTMKACF